MFCSFRTLLRTVLTVAVCCVGGFAAAQAPDSPSPEHAHLQAMVGTWDAVMEMGGGLKSKATATYKSACNGMWVAGEFESNLGGIPYQGHGMDGYDKFKKHYVSYWFDSMSSTPMAFEGNFDADNKVLTMTGTSPGPDGKLQQFRSTTEMHGADQMTFKMYMTDQGIGQEQLSFTIEYTRRK